MVRQLTPLTSPSRNRILLLSLVGIILISLIIGTIYLVVGPENTKTRPFVELISRLSGSNLQIKADRTILPADGRSQSQIRIETTRISTPASAAISEGTGQLIKNNTKDSFIYTSGTLPGKVVITVTAGRFNRQIELTLVDANTPTTPQLVAPPDNSKTNNPLPEVAGTGPINTKIIITDNGNPNTTTTTDDKGNFRIVLSQPLSNGNHSLTATAVNNLGVISPVSNQITISVQTEPTKVDTENIKTTPARIIAGESFGLFIPASTNTSKIVIEFQNRNYELLNVHNASIFSGTLAAPAQPGSYSANVILIDIGGNPTRFDNLLRLTVYSP